MHIQFPKSSQVPGHYDTTRRIPLTVSPARSLLEKAGMDEENLPVVSVSDTSQVLEEIVELVGEPPQISYLKENGLYIVGYKPSCIIIGSARNFLDASTEVPFLVLDDLTLLAPLVQKQQPYSVFLIDASYQNTISIVDTIVREAAHNRLYFNHRPLVSVVEKGRAGLLPELGQRYAQTPFRFIRAEKHGDDVIDAQLFGQLRY